MRRIAMGLGSLLLVCVVLILGLVANALRQGSVQVQVSPRPVSGEGLDGATLASKLSSLVQLQTVSMGQGRIDANALTALHEQLLLDFPVAHEALELRSVGNTLVYTWRGSDPSLAPGALLAHQDVVPVADPSTWIHPPFLGVIADGFVWGRGTLDDKQSIVAQLAAIEALVAEGYRPRRTLYFVFGHDEEMGGSGARAFATSLAGEELDFVLDEGGMVSVGVLDGLSAPAALIGISEKGYASLQLSVHSDGGHSSMPPPHTAVGRLAKAIVALEDNPLPAHLDGPTGSMFDHLAPEMDFGLRIVMSNRWLLGSVVASTMGKKPSSNATLRTTQAVTMAQGSQKDNVLPQVARAVVNFRIVPGDSVASVIKHVQMTVGDDIQVEVFPGAIVSEPSPVSKTDGPAWDALNAAIRQTWPEAVVTPFLFIGATDSRFLTDNSERVWRFAPMALDSVDLKRLHGKDERISLENLEKAAAFYVRFIEASSK